MGESESENAGADLAAGAPEVAAVPTPLEGEGMPPSPEASSAGDGGSDSTAKDGWNATGHEAEALPPNPVGGRRWGRWLKRLTLCAVALALLGALSVALAFHVYGKDLPGFESLMDYAPPQVTKVYDRNGVQVAEFFNQRRTVVGISDIPQVMRHAMVSAEDGNFYQHSGLDYVGILRALLVDMKEMRLAQGASTITQQVIKNMVLSSERKFSRKIKEAILARRIEQNLTKDEILTLYLNHIYFGSGRYGIYEASTYYFGKEPKDLTLGEAAMLAGMPQSPVRLSPLRNPERARRRQAYVLDQMARNGFITQQEADAEKARPLTPVGKGVGKDGMHYVEAVRRSLMSRYDRKTLYEGGLRIRLAMDLKQQAVAEKALAEGLENLEKKSGLKAAKHVLSMEALAPVKSGFAERLAKEAAEALAIEAALRGGGDLAAEGEGAGAGSNAADNADDEGPDEVAQPPVAWDFSALSSAQTAALEAGGDDSAGSPAAAGDAARAATSDRPSSDAIAKALGKVEMVPGQMTTAPLASMDDGTLLFDLGTAMGRVDRQTLSWAGLKKGRTLDAGGLYRVRVLAAHPKRPKKSKPLSKEEQDMVPLEIVPVPTLQSALAAVEPKTHQVTALVGGYDFAASQFNRATQARRQPGSSFKPIVYGAALESGRFTLASIVNDAPEVVRDRWTGKAWTPQNFERNVYDGPMTLRQALSKSKNTVSVRLIEAVGPEAVIDFARRVGISSPLPSNLTLGLGTGEVSPLELANAYATLAAGGMSAEPVTLLWVKDRHGKVLEKSVAESEEVVSPAVAFLVTSLMRSVVEEGTGRRALELKRPVAGKTGTASENRDAWFSGFTPDLVATVWVGRDDHKPIGRAGTGGAAALPVWVGFMKGALEGVPPHDFAIPPGVEAVRIDTATGRRILLPEEADDGAGASDGPAREGAKDPAAEGVAGSASGTAGAADPKAEKAHGAAEKARELPGRVEYFVEGTAPEEVATGADEADPRFFLMEAQP